MRATFEDEEELESQPAHQPVYQQDRELTLSSTTLLVIFFGLVLICGLCFAFGYTLGRRAPSDAGPAQAATIPAAAQTFDARPKPSAAGQTGSQSMNGTIPAETVVQAEAPAPPPKTEAAVPGYVQAPADREPSPPTSPARAMPEAKPEAKSTPQPAVKAAMGPKPNAINPASAGSIAPATVPGGTLVQIAAVSNPEDADVLLGALRKKGYSVNVRHEPSDVLLHVQVGPFANRADAVAMRQKLLADGYNAILK